MKLRYLPILFAAIGVASIVKGAGKVVSTLPELTEGVYVLGSSTSTADATATGALNFDYIDWDALNVPDGATVRLNGAVVLDALPTNFTIDWSACTRLALVGANLRAAGKTLTIPATLTRFLAYNGTVTVNGEAFTITKSSGTAYPCTTDLNCVMDVWNGYVPYFSGALTGAATGQINVNNYGMHLHVLGSLNFKGYFYLGGSQQNQGINIYTPDAKATLGKARLHHYGSTDIGTYICQTILYDPQRAEGADPCTLDIGYLLCEGETIGVTTGADKYRRFGAQVCVFSNNTVNIKSFQANNTPLGLYAGRNPFHKNSGPQPTFDEGIGNVILSNGGNMTGRIYVSPNINVTMTGNHAAYGVCTQTFYYNVETNVVNQAEKLSFNAVSSYPNDGALKVVANEPANLPKKVIGQWGRKAYTHLTLNSATWTMPFDFGAADVNPARCETDVKVIVPASGTVTVTNMTTAANAAYPAKWTEYPILTCNAGGTEKFANWTVNFTGNWPKNIRKKMVVKDTGLYISVRKANGVFVMFHSTPQSNTTSD